MHVNESPVYLVTQSLQDQFLRGFITAGFFVKESKLTFKEILAPLLRENDVRDMFKQTLLSQPGPANYQPRRRIIVLSPCL
jgi:hypothetical protein